MPTLYVTEPGAVVRRSVASLVVTVKRRRVDGTGRREEELAEVEPHRLEMIGLIGRAHITSDATRLCLEKGIAVSWFTRGGDFVGRLVPEISRTADLRLAQYRLAHDGDAALALSRAVVGAKLRNAAAVLSALRANRPGRTTLGQAIHDLRVSAARCAEAKAVDVLMGIEGDGARVYFGALGDCFSGEISFGVRARRPPPDPANALLSFGYVLLGNMLASLLEARGFDPYLGFFHTVRSGRPSLALDLLEELRHPLVDRLVVRVCNLRQVRPEHFEPDRRQAGGVRMTRDGLRRFFRVWERCMNAPVPGTGEETSAEALIRRQVDCLASHVRGDVPYAPFQLTEKS